MKKNIIPDSKKVISTFNNKYAVAPGTGTHMPPMGMQPMQPMPQMPPMGMQPMPQMPPMGMQPMQPMQPSVPTPSRPPVMGPNYIQGYLQQFIGEYVRIDFLVGTGTFIDRDGILTEVGIDYVEMREVQTGNLLIGDLYSIKFVTVYSNAPGEPAF